MWIFSREAATGIIRTVMPFVWSALLAHAPTVGDFLAGLGLNQEAVTVAVGGVLYVLIRWLAEKVPAVGYLLVVNKKPDYTA